VLMASLAQPVHKVPLVLMELLEPPVRKGNKVLLE